MKVSIVSIFLGMSLSLPSFAQEVKVYRNQDALAALLSSDEFQSQVSGELHAVTITQAASKVGQVFIFTINYTAHFGPATPKQCSVKAVLSIAKSAQDAQGGPLSLGSPHFEAPICSL